MRYWRCKCGKSTMWESGKPPSLCEVCIYCGSTLAMFSKHEEPVSHEPITEYDIHTGKPYQRCKNCGKIITT
jgi:hypothetical protein